MSVKKLSSSTVLLAALLVLTSCSQVIVVTATPDPNIIRTEAVRTAMAQLTQIAAANPTNTPMPTPKPITATTAPTATSTTAPTFTPQPTFTLTAAPVNYGSGEVKPTATWTNLRAQVLSTDPKDWSTIKSNTDFDIRWWVKNTGSVEWTTGFWIQYISGSNVHKKEWYHLRNSVGIGDEYQFIVDAKSGLESGLLSTRWGFYDNNGNLITTFTLNVYVK
jgi:hypothetical protein